MRRTFVVGHAPATVGQAVGQSRQHQPSPPSSVWCKRASAFAACRHRATKALISRKLTLERLAVWSLTSSACEPAGKAFDPSSHWRLRAPVELGQNQKILSPCRCYIPWLFLTLLRPPYQPQLVAAFEITIPSPCCHNDGLVEPPLADGWKGWKRLENLAGSMPMPVSMYRRG